MESGKLQIHAVGEGTLKGAKAAGWSAVAIAGKKGTVDINSPELEDLEGIEIPLTAITSAEVTVGIGNHGETLVGRCTRELGKIGIVALETNQEAGLATFGFLGTEIGDLLPAAGILLEVSRRSTKKVVPSDHQMSWYDVKQAIGLVWAAQNGDEDAAALIAWGDEKINIIREQEKAVVKAEKAAIAEEKRAIKAAEKQAADDEMAAAKGAAVEVVDEGVDAPELPTAPLASTLKAKK